MDPTVHESSASSGDDNKEKQSIGSPNKPFPLKKKRSRANHCCDYSQDIIIFSAGSVAISAKPCPTQRVPGGAGFEPGSDLRQGASRGSLTFPISETGRTASPTQGCCGRWETMVPGTEPAQKAAAGTWWGLPRGLLVPSTPSPRPAPLPSPPEMGASRFKKLGLSALAAPGALDCEAPVAAPWACRALTLGPRVTGAALGEPVPRSKGWYCW